VTSQVQHEDAVVQEALDEKSEPVLAVTKHPVDVLIAIRRRTVGTAILAVLVIVHGPQSKADRVIPSTNGWGAVIQSIYFT
jgi:hypothetical protein